MMEKPPPSESLANDDDDEKMAACEEQGRGVASHHLSGAAQQPPMMAEATLQMDQDDQMLDAGEAVQSKRPGKKVKANAKSPPRKRAAAKKVKKPNRKPRDMPSRPLSAYNIFFREERIRWLEKREAIAKATKSTGEKSVGGKSKLFIDMGKAIGSRWRVLSGEERAKYHRLADADANRYRLEMEAYNDRVMREKNPHMPTSQQQQQQRQQLGLDRSPALGADPLPSAPAPLSSTSQHMGREWDHKATAPPQHGVPLTGLHAYLRGDLLGQHHLGTAGLEQQLLLNQLLGSQGAHQQPLDLSNRWQGSSLPGQHRNVPDLQLLDSLSEHSLRRQLQGMQLHQQQQTSAVGSLHGRMLDEQLRSLMEEHSRIALVQEHHHHHQQQQQRFTAESNFPQLDAQLAHLSLYRGALDPLLSHHNQQRGFPPYDQAAPISHPPTRFDQALAQRGRSLLQDVPATGAPSDLSTPLSDTLLRIGQEASGGLSYPSSLTLERQSQEQTHASGGNPELNRGPPGPSDNLQDGSFPGGLR